MVSGKPPIRLCLGSLGFLFLFLFLTAERILSVGSLLSRIYCRTKLIILKSSRAWVDVFASESSYNQVFVFPLAQTIGLPIFVCGFGFYSLNSRKKFAGTQNKGWGEIIYVNELYFKEINVFDFTNFFC